MTKKNKHNSKLIWLLLTVTIILLITVGVFYVYTLDYYRAEADVHRLIAEEGLAVDVNQNITVVHPDQTNDRGIGLIFYPGGKVEAIAYLPLLYQLSRKGITCFLIEMPFNLAVFNINAANSVFEEYPEFKTWFLAGHSLGGAMASSYMNKNYSKVDGLILMGAYPINDAPVPTLAIYGSEDVNLDLTKLEGMEQKIEISGGNHAYFGNYGEQKGDGTATITREEQQTIAVLEIVKFINNRK